MKRRLLALMLATIAAPVGAGSMTAPRATAIDAAVRAGMARVHARGLALAVVENGRVVLVRSYGARNAAGAALAGNTIMYGASLTKAVFAYTAMRLADEGKLRLDEPIAAMLAKPLPAYGNLDAYGNWGDLAGDERWRGITPRMLLTHSAGFANFSFLEPDRKLRVHWAPGSRYGYSGEGIVLLQFALEQRLGHGIGQEIDRLTLRPLRMRDTGLQWRADFAGRVADGWQADGTPAPHDERSRVRASGSMDTTIGDMARFAAALVSGTGLSRSAHAAMLRPTLPITTAQQFPTLAPELPPAQRRADLAAGLGVVTFAGPQGRGSTRAGMTIRRGTRWCAFVGVEGAW